MILFFKFFNFVIIHSITLERIGRAVQSGCNRESLIGHAYERREKNLATLLFLNDRAHEQLNCIVPYLMEL